MLLEGSVLVEFDNLSKSRILRPGEQLVFNKDDRGLQLKVPDIEDVTAWKRGELVFRQMTISDIITVLERRFDVTFVYRLHDFSTDRYSFRFREDASLEERDRNPEIPDRRRQMPHHPKMIVKEYVR